MAVSKPFTPLTRQPNHAGPARRGAVAGLALALAGGAAWAGTPAAPQSTAVGIAASFRSQGLSVALPPVAALTGQPSGAYDDSETVGKVDESVIIIPQAAPPVLAVSGGRLTAHVSSTGIGIDSRSSEGDTSLSNASLLLYDKPATGSKASGPWLRVSAREVMSSADFNQVYGSGASASGTVDIGALSITGQLVGGAKLTYSGAVPPNTVIYQSPTVTVTLNREIRLGLASCTPGCTFKVVKIDVAAVDIALNDAVIDGHKVSGDILIDDETAQ